jgi:cation/acetate symporter
MYLGRMARSSGGYFAAGGQIHWGVNGIAFAGDYLSAASFLGICGMIAFSGYDGFLYSIGYLAGWIVALFVVAEPMKRLGRYTFTDALDSQFNHRGIQLAAGLSTLIVSVCYLIPQMVGAGSLVEPLLGLPHHWGVIMVGGIVIFIVATAGMASTTYVQFLKGGLLIIFSLVLAIAMCSRGISTRPEQKEEAGLVLPYYEYRRLPTEMVDGRLVVSEPGFSQVNRHEITHERTGATVAVFYKLAHRVPLRQRQDGRYTYSVKGRDVLLGKDTKGAIPRLRKGEPEEVAMIDGRPHVYRDYNGEQVPVLYTGNTAVVGDMLVIEEEGELFVQLEDWWLKRTAEDGTVELEEVQSVAEKPDEAVIINGAPKGPTNDLRQMGRVAKLPEGRGEETGSLGPFDFFGVLGDEETAVELPKHAKFEEGDDQVTVYYPKLTPGNQYMRPGLKFPLESKPGVPLKKRNLNRLNFVSLMLALFFGTAALPHILIRYYTVPSPAAARKSTIVAIASIGFFYVLTLYLGTGATVNGAVNPADSNMSAPLLARSFNEFLFAVISAIAFATVLGTVSGLIVASSGALAHDLLDRYCDLQMSDKTKVLVGKLAAFSVGLVAIILGIVFQGMNVSFLVGWAFAVAASANLPAILMILFWKRTTAQGVVASILVGTVSALGIILLSPDMFMRYGYSAVEAAAKAPMPISQPGIFSIPLSFVTLVVVSMMTRKPQPPAAADEANA